MASREGQHLLGADHSNTELRSFRKMPGIERDNCSLKRNDRSGFASARNCRNVSPFRFVV
jgi:hypothetical protein